KRLLRRRGLMLERPFAHCYETGGMRRLHLRGRENILKRLLIHVAGFNLSLVLRLMIGKGTPRGLQDLMMAYFLTYIRLTQQLLWILAAKTVPGTRKCSTLPSFDAAVISRSLVLPRAARAEARFHLIL